MQALANPADLKDSRAQRQTMVDCQIRTFDVTDHALLGQFLDVPRERFVPDEVRDLAYSDIGFSIPASSSSTEARYILPPLVLARMIQGARVKPSDRVLDVACGFGYSSVVMAGLAGSVSALEGSDLREQLAARLSGVAGVRVVDGSIAGGASTGAPFDVVFVNGAVEGGLEGLFAQLTEGGRLVAIRRDVEDPSGRAAQAICFEKRGNDVGTRYLFAASAPVLAAFRKAPQFVF